MKNLLSLKLTLSTDFGNSNPQDEALVTPSHSRNLRNHDQARRHARREWIRMLEQRGGDRRAEQQRTHVLVYCAVRRGTN